MVEALLRVVNAAVTCQLNPCVAVVEALLRVVNASAAE
jgi:hypothetical protein